MSLRARTLAWSAALFAQLVFGVSPSFAQAAAPAPEAKPAKEEAGVEVITVTARRKEENIQDIPIAVSAFSADDLSASNIDDVADVQFNVPNLTFSKTNFSGAGNISIRGVGNLATAATAENGTGIHINDAPFPGTRIFETEFYDVGSVQVLRGPQGTLFGRSSPGGAINVYTKKPVMEDWGGYAQVEYGDYNHAKVRAALNIPLGEHFAARAAGIWFNRDGTTRDLNTNKKIDDKKFYATRLSLHGEWDNASFDWMAQYFRANDHRMRIQQQGCTADTRPFPNGIGCLGDGNPLQPGGINYNSTLGYSSGIITDTFSALTFGAVPRFLSGPQALFAPYLLANEDAAAYFFNNPCTVAGGCPGYVLDDETATGIFGPNPNGWGLPSPYYTGANRPGNVRRVRTQLIPTYVADEFQTTFTANFDVTENLKLTSVTGWHRAYVRSETDYWWSTPDVPFSDGPRFYAFPDSKFAGLYNSEFVFDRSASVDKMFTQEVRLVSSFDGIFNFQGGAIYNNGLVNAIYNVWATSLEDFWKAPGDPVGLCPAAHVEGFTSCFDAAPETSYYKNETKPTTLQSYALFGELYFDLTQTTRLTVGARYTDDKKADDIRVNLWSCDTFSADPSTGKPCGRTPYLHQEGGWTKVIWKVSLDQHFDLPWAPGSLAYFTVSTGYKGGGFNPAVSADQSGGTAGAVPAEFKPEDILAYEIGYKGTWFDQLQLGLTGFYYDYTDMQIGKIVNRTAVNENFDSKIGGVELETVWAPSFLEGLKVDMNVSWLRTRLQGGQSIDTADPTQGDPDWIPIKQLLPFPAGQNAICEPTINPYCIDPIGTRGTGFEALIPTILGPGGGLTGPCATARIRFTDPGTGPVLADQIAANPDLCGYVADGFPSKLKGKELPGSPEWTLKVGAQYSLPAIAGWVATPRLDFYWHSDMWGRVYNTKKDLIKGWEQLDANMQITKEGSGWMFELWAKNLQGNNDITGHYFTDPTSANFTNEFLLEPRTFGGTIRYTFGGSEF
jgi:outer membrane receptor protein involved in Fe transport